MLVSCFVASGAVLITGAEVHRLSPSDAAAKYPVRIRGVVTSTDQNGGMVQDATRGVYVAGLGDDVQPGEHVEVEGVTGRGTFAPMVNCTVIRRLGPGVLPEPIRPTWEQLNNGSMDCQYVEIEGIATEAYWQTLVLLLPEGQFGIAIVPDSKADLKRLALPRYANKHLRLRGTVFATRDNETHRVRSGSIGLGNPSIVAAEPVLTIDKQIGQLLQFDARAAGFHRVKVAGQIVYARDREYYLSDRTHALRFVTRKPTKLAAGDQVEAVGFPRVAGSAPVLIEASARKTGHAALSVGRNLPPEDWADSSNIGMRVALDSRLIGIRTNRSEIMLDLQAGSRTLIARLERKRGELPPVPIGSLLRITGVYVLHGRERDSAELLLNSTADIRILERPSWWTPARALESRGELRYEEIARVMNDVDRSG